MKFAKFVHFLQFTSLLMSISQVCPSVGMSANLRSTYYANITQRIQELFQFPKPYKPIQPHPGETGSSFLRIKRYVAEGYGRPESTIRESLKLDHFSKEEILALEAIYDSLPVNNESVQRVINFADFIRQNRNFLRHDHISLEKNVPLVSVSYFDAYLKMYETLKEGTNSHYVYFDFVGELKEPKYLKEPIFHELTDIVYLEQTNLTNYLKAKAPTIRVSYRIEVTTEVDFLAKAEYLQDYFLETQGSHFKDGTLNLTLNLGKFRQVTPYQRPYHSEP